MIRGTLHLFGETGTEGNHWAIQNEDFIHQDSSMPRGIKWEYAGLEYLQSGDYLKIYSPEGGIYWEGELSMKSTVVEEPQGWRLDSKHGAHTDPVGIDIDFFAKPFLEGYTAELTKFVMEEA